MEAIDMYIYMYIKYIYTLPHTHIYIYINVCHIFFSALTIQSILPVVLTVQYETKQSVYCASWIGRDLQEWIDGEGGEPKEIEIQLEKLCWIGVTGTWRKTWLAWYRWGKISRYILWVCCTKLANDIVYRRNWEDGVHKKIVRESNHSEGNCWAINNHQGYTI